MPLKIESQGNGDAKMKFVGAWLSLFAKGLFSGAGYMGEGKNMLFQGVVFWMSRQRAKTPPGQRCSGQKDGFRSCGNDVRAKFFLGGKSVKSGGMA
jgi:hypothetical protein